MPTAWLSPPSPTSGQGQGTVGPLAQGKAPKWRGRVPATHTEVREEDGETRARRKGLWGTLKSDREAISSSSSLVAEEAEIRVCCWLEVTRWGLLISPWLTVMAGLQAGTSQGERGPPLLRVPHPQPWEAHWPPISTGGGGCCRPAGQS